MDDTTYEEALEAWRVKYALPPCEEGATCSDCIDEAVYVIGDEPLCAHCAVEEYADRSAERDARALAERYCVLDDAELPDPETIRCARHNDMLLGNGDWLDHCRHTYTNYDELISHIDRGYIDAMVYYEIRARCDELIEQAAKLQQQEATGT